MNDEQQQPQAGWVFKPGQQEPVTPQPSASAQIQPAPPEQQLPGAPLSNEPVQLTPSALPPQQIDAASNGSVSWTASEYVAHQKGAEWFISLGMGAIFLAIVIYLLTKDALSPIVVIVVAVIFGSFAARKPQVLEYRVDRQGIKIGPKIYAYSAFKSFSVSDDSVIGSINFLPVKRFMPGLTIHFEDADGDKIVDAIGSYLPLEEHKPEIVERVMNKLRF